MESESGPMFSGSESSEEGSRSPLRASSSHGGPKKRKNSQASADTHPRVKRLKPFYNDKYRELFNETVDEIVLGDAPDENSLPSSQIGATLWSSEEKEIFFSVLAKRGRNDVRQIAADIGSKSESEVQVYLELLQKATTDLHATGPSRINVSIDEIKAAVEVSQECCAGLDLAADALSAFQQNQEEKLEMKQYPKFWLLTPKIAKWVDSELNAGDVGADEVSKALPAANLLNLKSFLTLSKHIFMNSRHPENNWRTYAGRRKTPSIMYTAFSDFHNVAGSITKRLVQSTLFFTTSRLRAMNASGSYTHRQHVKRRDVVAALNVLGMESNGTKIWRGTARKCKLRVYDKIRFRQVWGKRYSYDEVEAALGSSSFGTRGRYRAKSCDAHDAHMTQEHGSSGSALGDLSEDDISLASLPSDGSDSSPPDGTNLTNSSSGHRDKRGSMQERFEQSQDDYVDVLDQQDRRKQEQAFWELLGKNPAEKMEDQDVQIPKAPDARGIERESKQDWMSWVDYAADWETFESPVPASNFVANRRLGRNDDAAAISTDSDSSSKTSDRIEAPGRRYISDKFVRNSSSSGDRGSEDDSVDRNSVCEPKASGGSGVINDGEAQDVSTVEGERERVQTDMDKLNQDNYNSRADSSDEA